MFGDSGYIVSYNGLSPWGAGTGVTVATPYVSLETEDVWQGGLLGIARTVTLNGEIPASGANIITGIRSCFASNFKPFIAPNVTMTGAMVQSISFSSQNFIGKVNYSIILKDFSGFSLNVNEPVDEITYENQQDGSVIINHRVSAIGIALFSPDMTAAFDNAVTFVRGKTGLSTINILSANFVDNTNKASAYLVSQEENINRAAASYGISEVFRYDPLRAGTGLCKRFSVELNSGINDDYVQVIANGTYQMGKNTYDSGLFAQVSNSELYAIASAMVIGLNPTPVNFNVEAESVTEGVFARSLNVKAVYDNSQTSSFFDYDFETNKDFHNGITQVSVKGQIIGTGRHVRKRYQSALDFYNNVMTGFVGAKSYIYSAARSGISALGYTTYALNPQPKSFSVTFNSGQGVISINGAFDDSPFVTGYTDFSWSVSSDCGLNVFKPHISANLNGSYVIQDLDIVNRSSVSINGTFSYPPTGIFTKTGHIGIRDTLLNIEGAVNGFLETDGYNISSGESIKTGFNTSYTKEGCGLIDFPADGKIYAGTRI